jgi:kynurenine formamidase
LLDLKQHRIIDLSMELHPRIKKLNGHLIPGKPMWGETRRLSIEQFIYANDKTLMCDVDLESHIGTHVECPYHNFPDAGKDVVAVPIETFVGEAVVVPLQNKKGPITPEDLRPFAIRRGDIVLIGCSEETEELPYLSDETVDWLVGVGIKLLGAQNLDWELPQMPRDNKHERQLLRNDIPLVEGLENLGTIQKRRVFFVGLPLKISGLDSSPIRAIAFEEI